MGWLINRSYTPAQSDPSCCDADDARAAYDLRLNAGATHGGPLTWPAKICSYFRTSMVSCVAPEAGGWGRDLEQCPIRLHMQPERIPQHRQSCFEVPCST